MGLWSTIFGGGVESVGNGVAKASEGIRYLLTGDLSPDARIELEELLLEAEKLEAEQLRNQVELNKMEAESPSFFKSAWRPAIGWIGVVGLFYHYIAYDMLVWYLTLSGSEVSAPVLSNTESLIALVMSMLGIGTLRTVEKARGLTK